MWKKKYESETWLKNLSKKRDNKKFKMWLRKCELECGSKKNANKKMWV